MFSVRVMVIWLEFVRVKFRVCICFWVRDRVCEGWVYGQRLGRVRFLLRLKLRSGLRLRLRLVCILFICLCCQLDKLIGHNWPLWWAVTVRKLRLFVSYSKFVFYLIHKTLVHKFPWFCFHTDVSHRRIWCQITGFILCDNPRECIFYIIIVYHCFYCVSLEFVNEINK